MNDMNELQVSTLGWDTTYTTTFKVMNEKIAENSTYPVSFDNALSLNDMAKEKLSFRSFQNFEKFENGTRSNASAIIKGKWGQWKLEKNGNGGMIYLRLPVLSGTISYGEDSESLDDGYLIVIVQLSIESGSDSKKNVLLSSSEKYKVSIHSSDFPKMDKESLLADLVETVFKRYLNEEKVLDEFRYVFSTVDINTEAKGGFAWLQPSDVGYAVAVPALKPDDDTSLFSILCMTDNATVTPYTQESVDAGVFDGITAGANAVLCISPQKFCEHLLINAAMKMFIDTRESDYTYSTNGMELHNNKDITFKNVQISDDKKDLLIKANNFSIHLVNDYIRVEIIDASYKENLYTAYVTYEQKIKFDVINKEGKLVFAPKKGEEFEGTTRVSIEPSDLSEVLKWVGGGLDILGGVMLLSGAAIKGLAKIVTTATRVSAAVTDAAVVAEEASAATQAAVQGIRNGIRCGVPIANRLIAASAIAGVIGLPFTLIETIATEIGEDNFENVPSLESFAENFLGNFTWTGVEKTTLKGARLNDAFMLDFEIE